MRSTGGRRINLKTNPNTLNDVLVQRVSADVGGYSGWHSHPGFGIVAVKSGTIAIYDAEDPTCTPTHYGPGEAAGAVYTEETGHVHFARNEGTVPFEAYATFVLPVGVPARTDELRATVPSSIASAFVDPPGRLISREAGHGEAEGGYCSPSAHGSRLRRRAARPL